MGWKIFWLLLSVVLIVGGLTGKMTLIGTGSSTALVVFGVVCLIVDVCAIATHKQSEPK
ncbi:MAG: hypothetical protein FWD53_09725 [Phycisphaerales bacterium]|nr:hypothetical protein [Phycisphaerales bacterium]